MSNSVVLYGAGSVGADVCKYLQARGVVVSHFLDYRRFGTTVCGLPVVDPKHAPASEQPVIISVFNAYVGLESIRDVLQQRGWRNIETFPEFFRRTGGELGDRYWLSMPATYTQHLKAFMDVRAMLADEKSQRVFDENWALRIGIPRDEPTVAPDVGTAYVTNDVPGWLTTDAMRLVDCGAYDGDTILRAQRWFTVDAVAAFEPDPGNFASLVEQLQLDLRDASYWPCAVAAQTGRVEFSVGAHAMAGRVTGAAGGLSVPAVALDDVIPTFRPTLIKMDIEGGEYDALLGARRIIQQHRPRLAVCVYHRPLDLLTIPRLLASWDLPYRYYLRSHFYNGFELVLYAVPSEAV